MKTGSRGISVTKLISEPPHPATRNIARSILPSPLPAKISSPWLFPLPPPSSPPVPPQPPLPASLPSGIPSSLPSCCLFRPEFHSLPSGGPGRTAARVAAMPPPQPSQWALQQADPQGGEEARLAVTAGRGDAGLAVTAGRDGAGAQLAVRGTVGPGTQLALHGTVGPAAWVPAAPEREPNLLQVFTDIVGRHGDERRAAEDARVIESEILGRIVGLAENRAENRARRALAGTAADALTSKATGAPPPPDLLRRASIAQIRFPVLSRRIPRGRGGERGGRA